MNDEEQVVGERQDDPLAEAFGSRDDLMFQPVERRLDGPQHEAASEPDALELLADDMRPQRV